MILILGVTASGKGKLAFELAKKLGGEIISVDSMKVYKRMDIGTAKPSIENRRAIPHHLIDVVEPSESFSVSRFLELTEEAVSGIKARGRAVVAVGGTAMYVKAMMHGLFEGPGTDEGIRNEIKARIEAEGIEPVYKELASVDPEAVTRIHLNDVKRIMRALEVFKLTGKPISSFQKQFDAEPDMNRWKVIGLRREKEDASHRINMRVKKMVDQGLVDEVKGLLAEAKPLSRQAEVAIGYAEIINYLKGNSNLDDAVEQIKINSRHLAKAQRTWFKTFRFVNWIDVGREDTVEDVLQRTLPLVQI